MQNKPHMMCVLLIAAALMQSTAGQQVATACYMPTAPGGIEMALHMSYAVKYYAPRFPQFSWRVKYLTSHESSLKYFLLSWIKNGTECDLLVGPNYSFLCIGISPLVEVPWLSAGATSTELSVKSTHASFSRVIPTDEVGAKLAGVIFKQFGWKSANILCSDESYGRSVAEGVSAAITELDGYVEVSRCLSTNSGYDRIRETIEYFLSTQTRVTYVASLTSVDWIPYLAQVVEELNANDRIIFVFSETFCSGNAFTPFPGMLCTTYSSTSNTVMAPFLEAYRDPTRRDMESEFHELVVRGYDIATLRQKGTNNTNIYAAFTHDATLHGMSAIASYHDNATAQALGVSKIQYLREHVSVGATGTIRLDENGDRLSVNGVVYNWQDGATQTVVGYITDGEYVFEGGQTAAVGTTLVPLHLLGATQAVVPSAMRPASELESSSTDLIPIIVPCVVVVVLVLALAPVIMRVLMPETRDNSAAVTNANEPFTVVFTDIQSSTSLWGREPEVMSEAVEMHHQHIRKLIRRFKGYEVKTIGDSFMCVFKDRMNAIEFALDIQSVFYELEWFDGKIDRVYKDLSLENEIAIPGHYSEMWNGIRVRVGIHHGHGSVQLDPVTLGYDYYGTVVNTAARVESVGNGGQVLATAPTVEGLDLAKAGISMINHGPQPLRGLDEPIILFQLGRVGHSLERREFGPLRLDHAVPDVEDENIMEATSEGAASSMCGSEMSSIGGIAGVAQRLVKSNPNAATPQQLVEVQTIVKTLFATSKEAWRVKTVEHLATQWRVPMQRRKLQRARDYDMTVLDLAWKAFQAARAKLGVHHHGSQHTLAKGTSEQNLLSTKPSVRSDAYAVEPLTPELPHVVSEQPKAAPL